MLAHAHFAHEQWIGAVARDLVFQINTSLQEIIHRLDRLPFFEEDGSLFADDLPRFANPTHNRPATGSTPLPAVTKVPQACLPHFVFPNLDDSSRRICA